jgi:glyoxylase I family protein
MTIRLVGLDHLVLRTRDVAGLIDFYCTVLGCTVEKRRDDLGLVHLRAGRSMIDLIDVSGPLGKMGGGPPGAEARNLDHFALRIETFDADAIRAHLAGKGITASGVMDNFGAEGTGPSIYVRDPDGNMIELKGPAREPATAES